jgi:hypothetical protein
MTSNYTVGNLLDGLPPAIKLPFNIPESARNRLIANPPDMIFDEENLVCKIKLADGKYLNIHVKSK